VMAADHLLFFAWCRWRGRAGAHVGLARHSWSKNNTQRQRLARFRYWFTRIYKFMRVHTTKGAGRWIVGANDCSGKLNKGMEHVRSRLCIWWRDGIMEEFDDDSSNFSYVSQF
jgi:hypothetical protein